MQDEVPILFRHDRFVVVDKPSGLLSVPGIGPLKQDCVVARIAKMFPKATGPLMVHRLDMDTSGLLVVALDPDAQRDLSAQFENRLTEKAYIAELERTPDGPSEGEIDLPMRLDVDNRPFQIVDFVEGRPAVSRYRLLGERAEGDRRFARVRFEPLTGRTHQLRVHAAFGGTGQWPAPERGIPNRNIAQAPPFVPPRIGLGAAIRGDPLYGSGAPAPRLMLHASELSFLVPGGGERLHFHAPAPF